MANARPLLQTAEEELLGGGRQLARHDVQRAGDVLAQSGQGADDHGGDERQDKSVFGRGRAGLVTHIFNKLFHVQFLSFG